MADKLQTTTVHAAYVVVINTDGTLSTTLAKPDEPISFSVERAAGVYDVFTSSKQLVDDIEIQLLADRVAKTVISALQPRDPSAEIKGKIKEALSDRGIETPVVE
jgi:hypothetical protein